MAALAALAVFHSNRLIVLASAALAAILILANLLIDKFVNQKILKQMDGCLKQLATGEVVEISAKQIKRHQMFKRIGGVARHYTELQRYAECIASGRKYESASTTGDEFYQSISKLNQHLDKLVSEENDWKEQEQKRNWMNQGVAKFSDIMRQSNRSLNEIAMEL
ncbi:MAG: hypothetical protein J6X32_08650, partial [Salinivirgaceae bacterium]|nr:hypothetical protein [Salinivirgaceae bacterium]